MDNLLKLRSLLEKNEEIMQSFENLVTASVLIGYFVSVKELEHKKNIYFATTFIKNKKEIHLDFSFSKSGELLNICTCNGDCKPINYSDKVEMFIKTIDFFKIMLLS